MFGFAISELFNGFDDSQLGSTMFGKRFFDGLHHHESALLFYEIVIDDFVQLYLSNWVKVRVPRHVNRKGFEHLVVFHRF